LQPTPITDHAAAVPPANPSPLSPFEAIGKRFGIDWSETREAFFANPDASEEAFVQRVGPRFKLLARSIDGHLSMEFDIHGRLRAVRGAAVEGLLGAEGPLAPPAAPAAAAAPGGSSESEPAGEAPAAEGADGAELSEELSEQVWALVDMLFWSLSPVWLGYSDRNEPEDDFTLPDLVEVEPSGSTFADGALGERLSHLRSR
jgi:hypothetical protein